MKNSLYYDSVVIATIDHLQRRGVACTHLNMVDAAQLSNRAIITAISRLAHRGRLRVIENSPPAHHEYEILSPVTELDRQTRNIHLQHKRRETNGSQPT